MALPIRKRSGVFSLLLVVTVVASLLVAAPVSGATTDDGDYGHGYMVVELSSSPLAHNDATRVSGRFDPTSRAYANAKARLEREHARFFDRLARVAPDATAIDEMFVTSNSVVLQLNGTRPSKVESIGGVHKTSPSRLYTLDMNESVELIGAPAFWTANAGRDDAGIGIKVGIIDGGIDSSHPFFDCKVGPQGETNKVSFGGVYHSGVGIAPGIPGLPAILGPHQIPGPGDWFYFSTDHGTHVAGTVGGCVTAVEDGSVWEDDDTVVSGVAPGVELWDYNVFPSFGAGFVAFGGSAFSHDIAAAIEDSVMDGMDVINMSLGGGVQGPHDFLAEVANAAVAAGVTVVTSAGNEGPGPYTVGSPGSAADVIAVGASTNTRGMAALVKRSGHDNIRGFPSEFGDFTTGPYSLVDWPGSDNLACSSDGAGDAVGGAVVLIERGACAFSQKVENAENAGAGGVIVYTDTREAGGMATSPGFVTTIPAIMIDRASGLELEAALAATSPIAVEITEPVIVAETPNEIAEFSSRGPVPFTSIVKPDLVAPGVNILSSVMTFSFFGVGDHGWELFDGTSMASPHVAGAAAALLAEHPGWTPAEVKSAVVTSATVDAARGSVFTQGGGLLNLPAAGDAATFFEPSNASFGLFEGKKPANGSVEITIHDNDSCTVDGVTGNSNGWVSTTMNGSTLSVQFDASRDPADDVFYGGYVDVSCGSADYHIPWGAVIDRKG